MAGGRKRREAGREGRITGERNIHRGSELRKNRNREGGREGGREKVVEKGREIEWKRGWREKKRGREGNGARDRGWEGDNS